MFTCLRKGEEDKGPGAKEELAPKDAGTPMSPNGNACLPRTSFAHRNKPSDVSHLCQLKKKGQGTVYHSIRWTSGNVTA